MELRTFTLQPNLTQFFPTFKCCIKPSFQHHSHITRRKVGILAAMASFRIQSANAFEFGFVVPGQTVEEAEIGVKDHAQDLLQVKDLLEKESWREAQKALRLNSALLKKDMYTIIQSKPGSERPQLRELYSTLFNNVSRLDYAARDKDGPQIWQCYENIVLAVNDILSRI
ncbi:PREDICTED: psbQ-like protein 3, chloroplastic isoform X2 [Lupinus angustifolius]|uniref:psbQ-like protein 3, chloroplastic isoform X2 n=1 Tax=Lupinus angustifolius TaxID=3871 RepID=UPI00092EA1F2|nr:PREDICTED: psbQ-like protein 3, chloroplastic isoform X2 [Lupinus angustifolius]